MKKIFIILFILIQFTAYGQTNKTLKKQLSLTMELPKTIDDSVYVTVSPNQQSIYPVRRIFAYKPNDGRIIAKIDIDCISTLNFSIGKRMILAYNDFHPYLGRDVWVRPEDKIIINIPKIDSRINGDVSIEGTGLETALFLKEFNKMWSAKISGQRIPDDSGMKESFDISEFQELINNGIDSLNRTYVGKIPNDIMQLLKNEWMAMSHLATYKHGQLDLENKLVVKEVKKLEALYPIPRLTKDGGVNIVPGFEANYARRAFIDFCLNNEIKDNWQFFLDYSKAPGIISAYYKNQDVVNRLIPKYYDLIIGRNGPSDSLLISIKQFVNSADQKNKNIIELKAKVEALSEAVRTGAKAFDFELMNEKNKTIKLSGFKGKVVLLDFMFNGCGGCAQITPKMEELEHKYNGKDVVFVSISIDKDFQKFKESIGIYSSKNSIHLYTNGQANNHEIIKHYSISGYPTLVLIDQMGNIVKVKAPRPDTNEKELMDMIDNTLSK